MLNNVRIQNAASYGGNEQTLSDLNIVNFIYGDNGSGKSTIAKLIDNDEAPMFAESNLDWQAPGSINTLVYNKEFIDDTLRETKVKGVFTFGEGAGPKQDQLEKLIGQRKECDTKIGSHTKTLVGKSEALEKEQNDFREKCWNIHKQHKPHFGVAFKGFSASKDKFRDNCIQHINKTSDLTLEDLKKQASTFFSAQPEKLIQLPVISGKMFSTLENAAIFKAKIVGKEDVPIAEVIKALGNSDWVRQGLSYYDGQTCPFCQQKAPDTLKEDLEAYFDKSYTQQVEELSAAIEQYKAHFKVTIEVIEGLRQYDSKEFAFSSIEPVLKTIIAKFEKNSELLDRKHREPSTPLDLDLISTDIELLNSSLDEIRKRIAEFNRRIDNFKEEKKKLVGEVWAFIGSEAKPHYDEHTKRTAPLNAAIKGITERIDNQQKIKGTINIELAEVEKNLTSIAPSKEEINSILNSFGFDNFSIEEDKDEGYYQIKRADGSFAQETLSEGERTFITFLYFYQLIQGSTSKEGISEPRIVVFDDPVSSLDSKILFIVSTLIRRLFDRSTLEKLNIKQIILLTHNVYFHKEVSFSKGLQNAAKTHLTEKDFNYWIVRKINGDSVITPFEENPIKTNYQLLWQEVKRSKDNPVANINICNTLRRILENYFTVLGGYDLNSLVEEFEGQEMFVCRSLTSWIHDGSHCMSEGIDIGFGQDLSDHYLPVFEAIFEKTGHQKHYEMMMESCG